MASEEQPVRKTGRKNARDTVIVQNSTIQSPQTNNNVAPEYTPSFTSQVLRNSSSKTGLPSYTEIHTVSPSAAGLPVLEVVRKLESENMLTKEDRLALKDGLYSSDVSRREEVVKALCEVELSMNSRFAIRKLKSVIHQNNSGHPTPATSSKIDPVKGTGIAQLSSLQYNPNSATADVISSLETYSHRSTIINSSSKNHPLSIISSNLNGTSNVTTSPDLSRKIDMKLNFNNLGSAGKNIVSSAGGKYTNNLSPDQQVNSQPQSRISPRGLSGMNSGRHSSRSNTAATQQAQLFLSLNNISPQRAAPQNDYDAGYEQIQVIQNTINQVVGDYPMYSGPGNYNVLDKISARLAEYKATQLPAGARPRKYAVVVGCGSFNPLTRMHLRTFYLAKQYIEAKLGYVMLGTLLSPAHAVSVRERYRTNTSEIIPAPHRLAVAQLLVQNSKWLSIDPWEITRRRAMDYLSLLEHVQVILSEHFPDTEIKVIYFAKGNHIPKLSPQALRQQNFGCICVCRAPESDVLRASLTGKWNGIISVAEDSAILDASLDVVTSRKVRDKVRAGESVAHLVGEKIHDYVLMHHIGAKMNGLEEWTSDEKLLPKFASRPAEPALRSQSVQNSQYNYSSGQSVGSMGSMSRSHTTGTQNPSAYYTPSWSANTGGTSTNPNTAGQYLGSSGLSSAGINTGSMMHSSMSTGSLAPSGLVSVLGGNLNNILERSADASDDEDN